jgi:hypothetical protein
MADVGEDGVVSRVRLLWTKDSVSSINGTQEAFRRILSVLLISTIRPS